MNIRGIGIDIVEVRRVKQFLSGGRKFRERIFTKKEIQYCEGQINPAQHYAARFAAKEAVWKSLDSRGVSIKNIEVTNLESGRPEVNITGNHIPGHFLVTLAHSKDYAVAQAIWTDGESK